MKHIPSRLILTSVLLLLTLLVGCNRSRKYPMQGQIVSKNVATNEITVKHGDIPGFMPAMAMPYHVQDPAVVQELQPGDKIAAEGFVSKDGNEYWLEDIRITDESARAPAKPAAAPHMLMPGNASQTLLSSIRTDGPSTYRISPARRCSSPSSTPVAPCRISVLA